VLSGGGLCVGLITRGSAVVRLLGLRVRIPPGDMDVFILCYVLSGRGLCVGLITRGSAVVRLLGLRVRIPPGGMDVFLL
jgi:hypothetical protein